MNVLRNILAVLLAAVALGAGADNLRWLSTEYDFGTIREEAGKANGRVQFVNDGPEATIIQRVKSTCGCTGVDYTRDVIAPGDTATVWFDYNPTGRPGRFLKHIKVYTGTDADLTSITIKGTVIGAPRSLESKYPVAEGALRLSADVIPMGETTYGTARHEYIHGYNQSADTLTLSWKGVPPYVSLGVSSRKVAPGDLFTLSAYLNTRDGVEIGTLEAPFTLTAEGGGQRYDCQVLITANVVPDLSALTEEQLQKAPQANVFPTVVELGELPSGKKQVDFEVGIKNDGCSRLEVKRIHAPQAAKVVKVKSFPKQLKPGEWKQIKALLLTETLPAGPFRIRLEVVTDDPLHPMRAVSLIGTKLLQP